MTKRLDFALDAAAVTRTVKESLAVAASRLDELAAAPGPDACARLDAILGALESDNGAAVFLAHCSPDAATRDAARGAGDEQNRFLVDVFSREDLYRAVLATPEAGPDPVATRLRAKTVAEFVRGGLALPAERRAKLTAVRKRILELESEFAKNLGEVRDFLAATDEDLDGLPEDYRERLEKLPDGRRKVTLDYPDSLPFMANARSASARERLYALVSRKGAPANSEVLQRLLDARREAAALLGYESHGRFILEERMAASPEGVAEFLGRLRPRLAAKADRERAELLALKMAEFPAATRLEAWDGAYYLERHRRSACGVDEFAIRDHLPTETFVAGVFKLCAELFGLRFEKSSAAGWHADARAYDCVDAATGRTLGRFYLDFHPRDGKYKHAAVFSLIRGGVDPDGSRRVPAAAMLVNFSAPGGGRPSLLKHSEAETFLHEFGHILHHVLSEVPFNRFAGLRVARDFVEAPSQIMENWAWDRKVLQSLSGHWKTGAPLPDALIDPMFAARQVGIGLIRLRHLAMSMIDQIYHGPEPVDAVETYRRVSEEVTTVVQPSGARLEAAYEHMISYAASFYGYLWSRVYAADMYGAFASDPRSSATGARYRREILAVGGSRDEKASVRAFLGREPSDEAFLQELGISEAVPS